MSEMSLLADIDITALHVLCVEDEADALEAMEHYLVRQGVKVLTASNGAMGLDMFLQHKPQLVISDIRMPEMDGIAMCRAIREVDKDIPIIIVSAHNETKLLRDAIDFGVTKYLIKPIMLPSLKQAVVSVAAMLEMKKIIAAKLEMLNASLSEADYVSGKLQSYVTRYMGADRLEDFPGVRHLYLPKGEVSGDFFCIEHFGDTLYAMVADGTGHGLSAILPVLQAPRIFKEQATRGFSLLTIADAINRTLHEQQLTEHFLATTLVRMNQKEGFIEVLNCGNPVAVLLGKQGDVLQEFRSNCLALGMAGVENFDADIQRYECTQAASLYVYTDGLPDTLDSGKGPSFNLKQLVQQADTTMLFDHIVRLVDAAGKHGKPDDVTLLEIKFDAVTAKPEPGRISHAYADAVPLHADAQPDMQARLKNLSVLLVEDDPETLEYMSRYLNHRVGILHTAGNGEEGLCLFNQYHPQLVIADIHLPMMSGISMIEAIRKQDKTAQVILISGSMEVHHIEDMMGLNVNRFLHKPFDVDKLLHAIQECVKQFDSVFGMKLSASVFMTSSLAITITGKNREIVTVNPAFCHITGYSREEVVGHNPRLLSSGKHDAVFYQKMWGCISETGAWSGELWNRRKNGELYLEWLTINVVKDDNNEVSHYIAVFSDVTERNAAEAKIRHLAQHDGLTDLPNRILFMDRARQALINAQREKETLAIMMLDIDHFKSINDSLGHSAGDALLCDIAGSLMDCVREYDTVCRLGGDEFAILLPNAGSREMVGRLAGKVIAAVNRSRTIAGRDLQVGGSIGISYYPKDGADAEELLKHADSAMYFSKKSGRNHYQFFDNEHEGQDQRHLAIQQGMRSGMQNGEFSMVYQPQYSLSQQRIVGIEALLRWNSPLLGVVSPAEFIPVAEETGFIVDIGEWVIATVCWQIAAWKNERVPLVHVSINISPLHFQRGNVIPTLLQALESNQLEAKSLQIELTEGIVMNDSEATLNNLRELKEHGFRVSIDDFGTGYSSLSYLRRLPIDELKIDRSFIMEIVDTAQAEDVSFTAIPLAIIQLAKNLKFSVVAEGVETKAQQLFLENNGCDVIQGYLYSRPISAGELADLLKVQ